MRRIFYLIVFLALSGSGVLAQEVIMVPPSGQDMTAALRQAILKAKSYEGKPVIIQLCNADYSISRSQADEHVYYVSNTVSESENPHPVKHIGLWLKNMRNITIDGRGARIITHGEMTPFVIDHCQNVTLRNFTLVAADPTVPEMTVLETDNQGMTVRIHPNSDYRIEKGRLCFIGEGWTLSDGIAQTYDPQRDVTWRSWSPLAEGANATEIESGMVRLEYGNRPDVFPGQIFQMRDGVRDEVGGLIQYSRDVTLEDLHLSFLGNFGVVGQMSENLTYRHLWVEPEPGSGRTCAGFADFLHFSGCKGRITVEHSRFCGSQDDPINVHGTHLAVQRFVRPDRLIVRYMHPQTFGFQSFAAGDDIELVNPHTLLPAVMSKIRKAEMLSPREIVLDLEEPLPASLIATGEWVVENVTCTPEVIIRHNYFARVPTRGVLVTTRRKVLIEGNTFFRTQMSGILIADDARSWYESGPVKDVTIRGNHFLECAAPVIRVAPENDENGGYVHGRICIENNLFRMNAAQVAVEVRSVKELVLKGNTFQSPEPVAEKQLICIQDCGTVCVSESRIYNRP